MHMIPDLVVRPANDFSVKAIELANAGHHAAAVQQWNQYLVLNPTVAAAYVLRGLVKASLGDGQGMLDDYRQASEVNPSDGRFVAMYNLTLGGSLYCAYLEDGTPELLEQAIEFLDVAVQAQPDEIYALTYRATAYLHAQKLDLAVEDCSHVIELHPQNAYAHFLRGSIAMNRGAFADAKEDMEIALENREQLEQDADVICELERRYDEILDVCTAG